MSRQNRVRQSRSGESKFRQNGFPKKYADELQKAKADWRHFKKLKRDKSKRNGCWCKLGRYLKTQSNRYRRAYEREMINRQDWDGFCDHKEMFVSSWDAC